jgi:hypothetical protein
MRWSKGHERRGMVLVMVALGLVVLMGMAALTVDVGRTTLAVQRAQSVADATAMAAALQLPNTVSANTSLIDALNANNDTGSWPQLTVNTSEDVGYYGPGDTVPGYTVLGPNEYAAQVTTRANEDYVFAGIAGAGTMQVARSATAKLMLSHDALPVIFAYQQVDWEDGFVSTGSGVYIDGAIHSNSSVVFRGSHITVTGLVEYRHSLTISGSDINLLQGSAVGVIEEYPIDFTWDDFLPWDYEVGDWVITGSSYDFGHVHVNGDLTIQSSNFHGRDGIIMVEGDVTFDGSQADMQNVTIIAKGKITFNGSCQTITPYGDNPALMALSSASKAIVFNGSGPDTEGAIFAPNGGIVFHGADASVHNGSLIALEVTMRGGQYRIVGTEDPSTVLKNVQLVQ